MPKDVKCCARCGSTNVEGEELLRDDRYKFYCEDCGHTVIAYSRARAKEIWNSESREED